MRRKGSLYLAFALGALLVAGGGVAALRLPRLLAERRLARVRADWQVLWRACQICGMDCGGTNPNDTSLRRQSDPSIPQTFEYDMEFMRKASGREFFVLLTTPIAYQSLKAIPRDPFRSGGAYYGYAAIKSGDRPGSTSPVAFLHSPGPDGRTDLEPALLREQIAKIMRGGSYGVVTPENRVAIRKLIDPVLYDPTNGAASGGDLILMMERQNYHYGFAWEADSKEWGVELDEMVGSGRNGQLSGPIEEPLDPKLILESERELKVAMPHDLFITWSAAGLVQATGGVARLDLARFNQVRGHLAAFADFFGSPRPLTAAEKRIFYDWQREDPPWWNALNDGMRGHGYPRPQEKMSIYEFYPLLALWGKSGLLQLAAGDVGAAPREAQMEVRKLNSMLRIFQSLLVGKKTLYTDRVTRELDRLCRALDQSFGR